MDFPFADGSYPTLAWTAAVDFCGCEYGCGDCAACGFMLGAAVAFGLMGMAEAIRNKPGMTDWTCRSCNTFNGAGALDCDDCGAEWTP